MGWLKSCKPSLKSSQHKAKYSPVLKIVDNKFIIYSLFAYKLSGKAIFRINIPIKFFRQPFYSKLCLIKCVLSFYPQNIFDTFAL